ncbi:MAG: hypothetical protein ABW224_09800 [Kibdelosporangium sp.]
MKNLVRGVLIFFAALEAFLGVWASVGPLSFYEDGPLPGLGWVRLFPPYNEHLVRDFGGLNLAIAAIFVVAAITLTPLLVRTVSAAFLLFSVPHTIFHTIHLEHFTPADAVVQTTGLVVTILLQVIVFVAAGRLERAPVRG